MNGIEEVFKLLVDAFDTFLNVEEKEIGCLEDKEHARVLADRNYYSQLLVEKLNGDTEQLVKEHMQKIYPMMIEAFGDDAEDEGNCERKRRKAKLYEK